MRDAYTLAQLLGCTVAGLVGRNLSAQEFEHWRVIMKAEQLHPRVAQLRHAQLLAAVYQGPSTRKGVRRPWLASDFMAPDPWADSPLPGAVGAPGSVRRVTKGRDVLALARASQAKRRR